MLYVNKVKLKLFRRLFFEFLLRIIKMLYLKHRILCFRRSKRRTSTLPQQRVATLEKDVLLNNLQNTFEKLTEKLQQKQRELSKYIEEQYNSELSQLESNKFKQEQQQVIIQLEDIIDTLDKVQSGSVVLGNENSLLFFFKKEKHFFFVCKIMY
ncbi:hypothetical protein RFI_16954 [Reticulomyxa filosa]|uniref:Uncharacterized protein n=1 Tax=Reticulomyxa filosa TaxID=46433 RepID=X6N4L4_RETFI|nr:hypothetical protein RFI_16954 [Reticulomyxa filosa]|eukprot:ETO20262.1 hypothetical protein RFI_16954 [Reticulomyxa filosa]